MKDNENTTEESSKSRLLNKRNGIIGITAAVIGVAGFIFRSKKS